MGVWVDVLIPLSLIPVTRVMGMFLSRSFARSLQHVNNEVLSLYYGIGQYISENTRHHFWGTGALKTISDQLQKEMPGLTGFGETSLKNMRTFYEEWSEYVNRQPAVDELPIDD